MKRLAAVLAVLLISANSYAVEVSGVTIEPSVRVKEKTLALNGYGIRKKLFFKIYIGSLYTAKRVSTPAELLADPGDKLIRMNFLHSKVEKEKITGAFAEGFANNSPDVAASGDAKTFLSFFTSDFVKGDVVDLALSGDGTVVARHNGKVLGTIRTAKLANAILLIYVGPKPASEDLKKGMLGIR
ncbi:MAG: chalcone isomerase family protein [Deltaproteobacteria bacterium]|nr:chalcone isomerase family protein [Deltaproteobacteria bacterium]